MRRKVKETDRYTLVLHGTLSLAIFTALIYPLIRFFP